MTTVLLLIVLVLLVANIVMMFTVWPRRQRAEIEKAVSALRREMAEHRGDSIRLMQAIRNEVEDAVQESLEREMSDFFRRGAGSQASFQRSAIAPPEAASKEGVPGKSEENIAELTEAEKQAQQMSLFQEKAISGQQVSAETPEEPESENDAEEPDAEPMERVQADLHDDIPDVSDIADLDEMD